MIENFISNLFGGKIHKSIRKSSKKRSSPKFRASKLILGAKKMGRNKKMYQVVMKGNKYVWKVCKGECKGVQQGPSPLVGKSSGGAKRKSKRSKKSKSLKKKSSKRKSVRKSVRKSRRKMS